MSTRYSHTCIVARDVDALAAFYTQVFDCVPVGPERLLSGSWLAQGTGLRDADFRGVHLRLPGGDDDDDGPTLELFGMTRRQPDVSPVVDRAGLMHLAFSVDDIHATLDRLLAAGGARLGEVAEASIVGVGAADFVYARDPEGNVVELQQWR
jgi:catechol 2,3-dioxygenase-like lactoylglutathione lyase family enzyme